jgi:hypothetical protein
VVKPRATVCFLPDAETRITLPVSNTSNEPEGSAAIAIGDLKRDATTRTRPWTSIRSSLRLPVSLTTRSPFRSRTRPCG